MAVAVASRRPGLHEQRADAVAIDAEILVAALRDDHFFAGASISRKPARILFQTAAEALIGDVDERKQSALGDDPSDLPPTARR